jgi:uncharacterized protein (DUF2141 family)
MRIENPNYPSLAMLSLALTLGAFPHSQLALAEQAASMTVRITGLRNASGKVWICLWKEEQSKSFPNCDRCKPFAKLSAPANAPSIAFTSLEPGAYAISFFHDENGDGHLATNLAGLPKSAIGTSNNPVIGFTSRPSFAKSRFLVPDTETLSIEAKYLSGD